MSAMRRRLLAALCRLLPREIADAAAGDLEEQWRRDARVSRAGAALRLGREVLPLLWCALTTRIVVSTLARDLRHALRLAGRDPRPTVIVSATLALGLGAATALFALTDAWLLRPLPFSDSARLAAVWETIPSQDIFENTPAPAVLFEWRARAHSFEGLGAMTTATANLTGSGDPERLNVIKADEELIHVLQLRPAAGRMPSFAADAPPEVMLSDGFWRRHFAASPSAIGAPLRLDGEPVTISGVLPPATTLFGIDADVWSPLRFTATERESRSRYLFVVGRIRDGVDVGHASAEVDAISQSREPGLGARVVSLQEQTVGSLAHDLPILFGATGVLLLIACVNVASLTLARTASRRREFALRAALGAGRFRLGAQVIAEALPAALAGGAAGLVLSGWLVRGFVAWLPQRDTLAPVPVRDPRVFVFGFVASIASAILFSTVPALLTASRRTVAALRVDGRTSAVSRLPLRALAAVEVALSVVLLIAATLVARSFLRLAHVDLGVRTDGVVTFELPRSASSGSRAFFDELLQRLDTAPAIASAGVSQALPLRSFGFGSNFPAEGETRANHPAYWRIVSPGYFDTMGIHLVEGRPFDRTDAAGAPRVAIVSAAFARATWPDGSALGRRIGWATLEHPMTVVGVASDIRLSAASGVAPHVYMPYTQVEDFQPSQLAVRARAGEVAAIDAVRRAAWTIDPLQPVAGIQTMDALAWRTLGRRRFQLALWTSFAAAAAVLALLGVYGVVSYSVRRSARELGIRLALGAHPPRLVMRILAQALAIAAAGAAAGVALAYATAGIVRGFLIAVEPRDPVVYASVVGAVVAAAALAALIPARRAARIDPLESLRAE
jgi:putative ABC transport system permease protein